MPAARIASWVAQSDQTFYARAFTPLITLWYLIFQRLNPNHTLSAVQEDARSGGADRLSPGDKKLSKKLRSEATTSYSDARQRLPLDFCERVLRHSATHTHNSVEVPLRFGLKLGLLDGSTLRCRPFGDLSKEFPPHRPGNCKKPPYWCLARVVGLICQATGVVVGTALGNLHTSEQALSAQLLAQHCWAGWLLAADRNFGVYFVARALTAASGHALLRLTEARARKLAASAGRRLKPGLDTPIQWTPTRQDKCPPNLEPTPVAGRLLAVRIHRRGHRSLTLYLFTTLTTALECPADALVQVYAVRWEVEVCFRYIKAQMELGFLECHSANMLRKEWLAGLIAYNLIRWLMSAAAAVAKIPVRWLSFSRARELLLGWCLRHANRSNRSGNWQHLLERIAKARLPQRTKARPAEPRALRHLAVQVPKLEGSRAAARKVMAQNRSKS
ncbi:MAG TPA: IS4 family transposase [Candidatus Dormibacteraeota bacterium]|nr:IS4 family transposase [Candidatus Dormibacteraeota bacterium]